MFIDARNVPDGTNISTAVCIVGAGAAGITLARELSEAGVPCVLLESGGMEYDDETQALYAGDDIGRPYLDLTTCRLRFFGGTTNHWGGWCMPLDPVDFETREGLPYRGWPFAREVLNPWYRRAQETCQIGPFNYAPADWGVVADAVPLPFQGPHFIPRIIQQSPPTRFNAVYGPQLRSSSVATVYLHANAYGLTMNEAESEVQSISVRTLSGRAFDVTAETFVVAAGGIENARLLLASGRGTGVGNGRDLVGRFFMTHLEFSGGLLTVADPIKDFYFDPGASKSVYKGGGVPRDFVSYVGLSDDTMRQRRLPNIKLRWTYEIPAGQVGLNAASRILSFSENPGDMLTDLHSVLHGIEGRSEHVSSRVFFRTGMPVSGLQLRLTLEPMPNPDSRIRLDHERDAIGMRQVAVDWRLTAADKHNGIAILRLLGAEAARTGFGRLRSLLEDGSDATWPDDMYGDEHHMGTTRMHRDPSLGVVDEDCRVHGVVNLYVAGSSVFPTAGAANPTLTITALALRLADHLKANLR